MTTVTSFTLYPHLCRLASSSGVPALSHSRHPLASPDPHVLLSVRSPHSSSSSQLSNCLYPARSFEGVARAQNLMCSHPPRQKKTVRRTPRVRLIALERAPCRLHCHFLLASHDIFSSSRHLPAIIYIIYASVAVSPASTIVILSRPHLQLLS